MRLFVCAIGIATIALIICADALAEIEEFVIRIQSAMDSGDWCRRKRARRYKRRLNVFITALALMGLMATSAVADDSEIPEERNFIMRTWDRLPDEERDIPWLVGDFNGWSGLASAALIGMAINKADGGNSIGGLGGQGAESGFAELGDDIYKVIPGTAYATSLLAKDYRGFVLMAVHNGISSGVMSNLKSAIGQRRPGDQDDTSYPSGHTNTAFLGAAFIQQRYGSRWGIPAYISAAIVGWSRIYGNKHYMNDVISGASIAMISAWAIVPPYDSDRRARWEDLNRERKFLYEWEMTLNDVDRNIVQAPSGSGDSFTSPLDTEVNEPWANSHLAFEYLFNPRQSVFASFSPWEIRSFGQFTQATDFAGQTFPADEQIRVAHLLWNFGVQYRHSVIQNERLVIRVGAGAAGLYADEEIFVVDDTQPEQRGQSASASATEFYPVVHADIEINLFWKILLDAETDYGKGGGNEVTDWSVRLKLRFNRKWDTSIGWREFASDFSDSELRDDFRRSGPLLNVTYAF